MSKSTAGCYTWYEGICSAILMLSYLLDYIYCIVLCLDIFQGALQIKFRTVERL